MSFILDALKKSETDRQQQASAEFATVPTGSENPGAPRWLWVLGLLLAINVAVLLGLLLRGDTEPALMETPAVDFEVAPAPTTSFADRIEVARQNAPPRQERDGTVASAIAAPSTGAAEAIGSRTTLSTATNTAALPTIHAVRAEGTVALPDLHLDIHVYSEIPADRFVFINMSKHREQSQLSEGPVVAEITPRGVVLDYRGTTFLLPRD